MRPAKERAEEEPTSPSSGISSEEDEVDELSPVPPPAIKYNRGRRTSVSAESMTPSNETEFIKVVIPKTDAQKQRIETAIGKNFLFRNLDEDQYKGVIDAMVEKIVKAGDYVIRQDEVGDYFYVVESGSLDVHVNRHGKSEKVTSYVSTGTFGELALMYNAPRAASVIGVTDCVLWALDRVTFRRILMENTSRKRRMYESFLEEVRCSTTSNRMSVIKSLMHSSRHHTSLVRSSSNRATPVTTFTLLRAGKLPVTKITENGDQVNLKELKKGDYFGGGYLFSRRLCPVCPSDTNVPSRTGPVEQQAASGDGYGHDKIKGGNVDSCCIRPALGTGGGYIKAKPISTPRNYIESALMYKFLTADI